MQVQFNFSENKRQLFGRFFLLWFSLFFSLANGQSTQTIRGTIFDSESKMPIPGAVISVISCQPVLSESSNDKGEFRIKGVLPGRHNIRVEFIGYHPVMLNELIVTTGKELVLEIGMTEKVYESGVVEIVGEADKTKSNNEMASVSARSFSKEETNRYAGSRGDPSRMATNFAGVSSGNDARNDIIVRGNSPLGVLWRLEGIDIPSPNHFSAQGATGGPISILNNNLLASSDFYTGAFPAEYGNRIAAAFDLRMRNGNNEKNEFTGQVGINGFELGNEGPLGKKGGSSYLINYRYSTLQVFDLLGIRFGVSGVPFYQDVSFKFNFPTNKAGIFSFWGIGGSSVIKLLDSEKNNGDWAFSGMGTDLYYGSKMGASGVSNLHFFDTKTSGKISLALSGAQFSARVDTLSLTGEKFETFNNKSTDSQAQLSYLLNSKLNAKNLIRGGVSVYVAGVNYHNTQYSRKYGRVIDLFNQKGNTTYYRAFLSWQKRFGSRLTLTGGLHHQYLFLNKSFALEPRLGLKYFVKENQSINFGYGDHSQMHPFVYYYLETFNQQTNQYQKTNINLDYIRARHLVLGYDWVLQKNFRIKTELYYQLLFDVPVEGNRSGIYSIINSGRDIGNLDLADSLTNTGYGRNAGWEITVEKFFSNHFYYLATVSVFESTYKGSDGILRSTAFNGGYVGNVLGGYEFEMNGGKQSISIDLRMTRAGGNRYIPVDLQQSMLSGTEVYDESRAFEAQLPYYQRFDIKVSTRINTKRNAHHIFLSLENILNRKNVLRQYFDPRAGTVKTEYQFGLFPIGGYRIEF